MANGSSTGLKSKRLAQIDYFAAAEKLGVEPAAIYAVVEVESSGKGFLPNGEIVLLFEAQWFHYYTNGKYDRSHPQISSPVWDRSLYYGGEKEHERYKAAEKLDKRAAMLSTSWGLFQIMGFNFEPAGYNSVEAYVDAMKRSEFNQLQAFISMLKRSKIDEALKAKDWVTFARRYNGAGYALNKYDEKLRASYEKYARLLTPHG